MGIPRDATTLSDDEVVENMIDWLEEARFHLAPWQANALRAILLCEHIMTPDGHRIPIPAGYTKAPCPCIAVNGLAFDWRCGSCGLEHKAVKTQAQGSRADYVVMDEVKRCNTFHLTVEDMRQCPKHGQGH